VCFYERARRQTDELEGQHVEDGIELADLIWQLRHELSRAMWAGERTDLRFEASSISLELTVTVERSTEPGVRARLFVVDAGTVARRTSTATQRICLTLHPKHSNDPDRAALIVGTSEDDER
jgi:Trypsin-co-occurring domain 2